MKIKHLLTVLCIICTLLFIGCSDSDDTAQTSDEEKALMALEALESGDSSVLEDYISAETYIQHNLGFPDGRQTLIDAVDSGMLDGTTVDMVRSFADGDYVILHSDYFLFGVRQVGFDIFRFQEGFIVEHWDNLQEIVSETASGRTQTDGTTEVRDTDRTDENKSLVRGLVENVFIGGNSDMITDYISTEQYIQHNPNVADGLAALGEALGEMAEAGTPMTYTENHMILGEGNFVLSVSEGRFLGNHAAFYDLFRIEDGKIVEHWDTIEEIPPEEEWANSNGKF